MGAVGSRRRSIGARLFIYVLCGALVGLGGMSYVFYLILEGLAEDEIQSRLRVRTTAIEGKLAQVEEATQSLSAALRILHRLDVKDPAALKALSFEFFQKRPALVMGVGFGQTPFRLLPDRQWFFPYFYVDQGAPGAIGERLPPPFEGIRYGELWEADKYPDQDYYKLSVAAGKKIWLEPFDWYGITMTSFYTPSADERGAMIGVVCADVSVTALGDPLREPVARGAGYFAILSDKGNLLAYPPDPDKAKVRTNARAIPALGAVWPRMQADAEGLIADKDDLWAYRRIESTRWLMLAVLPRAVVTRPVLRVAVGAALGAGVLLAIAVALFVRWQNRRLQPILRACEAMVEAEMLRTGSLRRPPAKPSEGARPPDDAEADGDDDEIGVLGRSFRQMSRQIQESFAALERTNEELEVRVEERTAFLKQLNEELLESQKKLEAAREAAESANRAKSEFLASMSHELRTPLNGVLGYAQLLLRRRTLSEQERHGIGVIRQCGSHLLTLINDILDLSKIEARKMDLHPVALPLRAFLSGVVEVCRVRAEQKGIAFDYRPSADLPEAVLADEKRLRQILLNVLGNAVKFTDQGGVTLAVTVLGPGRLRFRVEDTGPGMTKEQMEKIFTPFEQGAGDEREGTGLGLSISQKIAELMGSAIQVESEPGKGAAFWLDLELPSVRLSAPAAEGTDAPDIEGFEGPRRTILVIDDNAVNRSFLVDTLEPLGFTVLEAADGQGGLAKAKEHLPDLLITDLAMPGMDGLELVRRIRGTPELEGLVIIVSSASAFASDQHRSLEAGADDFLAKPVEVGELLAKLGEHLGLTWIKKPGEPAPDEDAEIAAPPGPELDRLLDLVKRGRINGVVEEARRLEQREPRFIPFARSVRHLARGFQLKELTDLLARYRG